jgi:tetratricopeptide (TPR) repeat protein
VEIDHFNFLQFLQEEIRAGATNLQNSVQSKYAADPTSVEYNNLMGIVAYNANNLQEALKYFDRTCIFTEFSDEGYMNNFASVHRQAHPDRSAEALLAATAAHPDNIVLLRELLAAYRAEGRGRAADEALQSAVLRRPAAYGLWVMLADSIVQRLVQTPALQHVSVTGSMTGAATQELNREADLVVYGLSMFPRSPELLLLRAHHYSHPYLFNRTSGAQPMHAHDTACAAHYLRSARRVRQGLSEQYLALMHSIAARTTAATASATATTESVAAYVKSISSPLEDKDAELDTCVPVLHRHDASSYVPVFHLISEVTGGAPWHAIGTARLPGVTLPTGDTGSEGNKGNKGNSIVPSAITKLMGAEGSAPLYLPSLQVL